MLRASLGLLLLGGSFGGGGAGRGPTGGKGPGGAGLPVREAEEETRLREGADGTLRKGGSGRDWLLLGPAMLLPLPLVLGRLRWGGGWAPVLGLLRLGWLGRPGRGLGDLFALSRSPLPARARGRMGIGSLGFLTFARLLPRLERWASMTSRVRARRS